MCDCFCYTEIINKVLTAFGGNVYNCAPLYGMVAKVVSLECRGKKFEKKIKKRLTQGFSLDRVLACRQRVARKKTGL